MYATIMRIPYLRDFVFSFTNDNTLLCYWWNKETLDEWLFRFDKLEDTQYINIDDYDLKKNDKKTYDSIILEFPYAVHDPKWKKIEFISYFINHLNKDWILFIRLSPDELRRIERLWHKPSWFVEWTWCNIRNNPTIKPILSIFKKDYSDKIFVASFDKYREWELDVELTKKHFIEWTTGSNLKEWFFVNREEFQSINNLKIREEIRNLNSEYKDFEMWKLGDLWNIMDVDMKNDEDNCIYIPNIWTMNVVSSIFDLSKNPQNYYKVKLKTNNVKKEYLVNYFKSELAQLSLKWCLSSGFIPKITKKSLGLLEIPVIWMEMQEKVIEAYSKLQTWKTYISNVEDTLSTSPKSVDKILYDLNGFEESLKGISEEGQILNLIRQWEWLKLEFKATFSKPVENKKESSEKDVRKSALKNIAWFMNNDGWTLLIWVADDGSIFWIENDNYKSDDQYLLNFKNVVRWAFTTENVLYSITYNIVEVEWKKVLRVDCPPSKEMIFLKEDNIDWAYVRANPSAEKIRWQDLVKYAIKREKDYEKKEKKMDLSNDN